MGVLARLGRHHTRTGQIVARLHQRRLVAVFGDLDALQRRLWLEAMRQGIRHASQVVWLSDGARGLWRLFEIAFAAYATGILDFYHAVQQLWKGAAAWLDGRTSQARRWFHWARHRLRHGHLTGSWPTWPTPWTWRAYPPRHGDLDHRVCVHLERHREHINYEAYKALGLPLGSGMVESACKWLIQQRFKGVGMRWRRRASTISYT